MEVSDQLHAPAALPLGIKPQVPTEYEEAWDPEAVWTSWRRGKSLSPPRNRTPFVQIVT
jgi:hypothetical protein